MNFRKRSLEYILHSCLFFDSLGVLQNQQVKFTPELPEWKREALLSFHMTTYTKIFVKFAQDNFWGDWEVSLRGDLRWRIILNSAYLFSCKFSSPFMQVTIPDMAATIQYGKTLQLQEQVATKITRPHIPRTPITS